MNDPPTVVEPTSRLSRTLARHIAATRYEELPPEVVDATKTSILDAVGVMIAASSRGETCDAFVDIARESGAGPSTVLGHGFACSSVMAAFANGAMAHALDFEDTHDATLIHPHAAVVPAALALAEQLGGISGQEFITAVALGADLSSRLGLGFNDGPEGRGFFHLPVIGAYGAAAACGKLLRLPEDALIHAFAIASSQAILSEQIKSYAASNLRGIRDAFTAKAGLLGALLARRGVKAFDQPFEGRAGLYGLHGNGKINATRMLQGLGHAYEGARVSYKPWPSCRGTHAFVEAAVRLTETHRLDPISIRSVNVTVSPFFAVLCEPMVQKQRPETAIDAKFSIPFTVAVALRRGTVTLEDFEPWALRDPATLALAARMTHTVESSWSKAEATRGALAITAQAGETYADAVEFPLGHPQNPISRDAIIAKFHDCLRHARVPLGSADSGRLADAIPNLEKLSDLRALFAA